jgi:LuxR family maltose regulon positive regulatory protein
VLDDYHTIDAPAIHQALALLIDYLPPHLHVMITTRVDPPLPLARWRARGALSELRAADLRFTPAEAATFLVESMELPLEPADVLALDVRTEGWVAGLQLAGLAMRDHDDRAGFISAFAGSNRFVVDYLVEEVFARQPAHIQRFLLQTAILDRMCGSLCDAVLGLTNDERPTTNDYGNDNSSFVVRRWSLVDSYSQLILEQLERANIFTIALDDQRRWYRYHHLFADVLRQRLAQHASAADLAALHQSAAAWYEQQGLGSEAVRHMLTAGDWERAAEIIEQIASSVAHRGQVQTVLGWLDALPEALVRTRPFLSIYRAAMLMYTNRFEAAEAGLHDAEESVAISMAGEQAQLALGRIAQTRAAIRRFAGDLAGAVTCAQQALGLLPVAAASWRAVAAMTAAHAYLVSGDVTPASERLVEETIEPVRASGNLFAAITAAINLARLQILQGRLRAAVTTCESLLGATTQADGLRALVGGASYYFVMGDILRERGDLDTAEHHLTRGVELAAGSLAADADVIALGYIALAWLAQARGDHNRAHATLDAFEQLAQQRRFFAGLLDRSAAARTRIRLAQGDLAAASRWAEIHDQGSAGDVERSTVPPFRYEYEVLTLTRVYIAQGHADAALLLLDRMLADAQAGARIGSAIEIQILRALALHTQGELPAALAALEQALASAEQQGYIRLFANEGAPIATLLHEALREGIAPEYVGQLLDAFPEPDQETRRQGDKETGCDLRLAPCSPQPVARDRMSEKNTRFVLRFSSCTL